MPTLAQVEERKQRRVEFKRILMAADFSIASKRALAYALAIARRYDAEILLVHAMASEPKGPVPMDPLPRDLNREWLQAERDMHGLELETEIKGVTRRIFIERGPVWDVIFSIIERENPDLLVLGTHGRGSLKELALESVAEEVLRLAPCPVLTVGPRAIPPNSAVVKFRSILFATDFGSASGQAFPYALSLAAECEAKTTLWHSIPPLTEIDIRSGMYVAANYVSDDVRACESRVREESLQK